MTQLQERVSEKRFFSTERLYTAPAMAENRECVSIDDARQETVLDPEFDALAERYGRTEASEFRETERKIFEDARKRKLLRSATEPGKG